MRELPGLIMGSQRNSEALCCPWTPVLSCSERVPRQARRGVMCRRSPSGPAEHGHAGAFLVCRGLHADAISRSKLQAGRQGTLHPFCLADRVDVNARHRCPGYKQLSNMYTASPRAPAGASLCARCAPGALCLPAGLQLCVSADAVCCQHRRPGCRLSRCSRTAGHRTCSAFC